MKPILTLLFFLPALFIQSKTISFQKDSLNYSFEELNSVDTTKGLLVLFNGGNGNAKTIDKETSINEYADSMSIQCIAISQGEWFINDQTYNKVKSIVEYAYEKYNVSSKSLYVGGFSLGGFTTIRISELAVEKNDSIMIPNAIFSIDPPTNYLDLYSYCNRELARDCPNEDANKVGKQEAKWIKNHLVNSLGNPNENDSLFTKESCFSKGGGNAKYLKGIPVLIFHEIDLMWNIENKCRDLRDGNIFMNSQMINYLHQNGNTNAKIITTQNKGMRSNGIKHPHSWSIADPKILFDWLLKF